MAFQSSQRLTGSTAGTSSAVSVTTSATLLAASNDNRISVAVQPTNGTIYVGYSSAVTTATGIPVASGATATESSFTGALYAIAGSTVDVRVGEV